MKFSVNWLKQWVDIDTDADQLADKLTAAGLEVDSLAPVAAEFNHVVIAEIESCQPHPDHTGSCITCILRLIYVYMQACQ